MLRGKTVYGKTSAAYCKSGIYLLFMGLCFTIFGFFSTPFFIILGVGFIAYGISQFFTAKKFKEK